MFGGQLKRLISPRPSVKRDQYLLDLKARSRAQKGKPKSEALRLAISKARKGKIGLLGDNGRARSVVCPAGSFSTIKEGAIAMGCDGGTFRRRIIEGMPGYSWGDELAPNKPKT